MKPGDSRNDGLVLERIERISCVRNQTARMKTYEGNAVQRRDYHSRKPEHKNNVHYSEEEIPGVYLADTANMENQGGKGCTCSCRDQQYWAHSQKLAENLKI